MQDAQESAALWPGARVVAYEKQNLGTAPGDEGFLNDDDDEGNYPERKATVRAVDETTVTLRSLRFFAAPDGAVLEFTQARFRMSLS